MGADICDTAVIVLSKRIIRIILYQIHSCDLMCIMGVRLKFNTHAISHRETVSFSSHLLYVGLREHLHKYDK